MVEGGKGFKRFNWFKRFEEGDLVFDHNLPELIKVGFRDAALLYP